MPARSSLNVSLTPELEEFVENRVATGRYQTASEVVREGLRLLELRERERDEAFKLLKAKLRKAAKRSETESTVDGEEHLDRLIEKLKRSGGK